MAVVSRVPDTWLEGIEPIILTTSPLFAGSSSHSPGFDRPHPHDRFLSAVQEHRRVLAPLLFRHRASRHAIHFGHGAGTTINSTEQQKARVEHHAEPKTESFNTSITRSSRLMRRGWQERVLRTDGANLPHSAVGQDDDLQVCRARKKNASRFRWGMCGSVWDSEI